MSLNASLTALESSGLIRLAQAQPELEYLFRHALGGQLFHLYRNRGRVLELNSQFDRAMLNYDEIETLAHERSDRQMELAALIARGTIHVTNTSPTERARPNCASHFSTCRCPNGD